MKKNYFLLALLSFVMLTMNAQFVDDMEAYSDGDPIYTVDEGGHWTDWGCGGTCALLSSSVHARSGDLSGYVSDDNAMDAVLDLGDKIFGNWGLEFWMYVPAGKEAYLNLQGTVPITGGTFPTGNWYFNEASLDPGNGYMDFSTANPDYQAAFTYPEDQWFRIVLNFDISTGISTSTFEMYIDGNEVVSAGTPFASWNDADQVWDYSDTISLGGIDLYSISTNNQYWVDDFNYVEGSIVLGNEDFSTKGFRSAMNNGTLTLKAQENINSVAVYNMLGQQVYNANVNAMQSTVDMSNLSNGTYIVKVNINGTEGSVKVIR
jgi:hypothetical protein